MERPRIPRPVQRITTRRRAKALLRPVIEVEKKSPEHDITTIGKEAVMQFLDRFTVGRPFDQRSIFHRHFRLDARYMQKDLQANMFMSGQQKNAVIIQQGTYFQREVGGMRETYANWYYAFVSMQCRRKDVSFSQWPVDHHFMSALVHIDNESPEAMVRHVQDHALKTQPHLVQAVDGELGRVLSGHKQQSLNVFEQSEMRNMALLGIGAAALDLVEHYHSAVRDDLEALQLADNSQD